MAAGCAVVTYELEHVGTGGRRRARRSSAPDPTGPVPAQAHRRPPRRAALRRGQRGHASPPGARSPSPPMSSMAAAELGYPVRLKAIRGGYDGRSQARLDRAPGDDRGPRRPDRLAGAARAGAGVRGGAVRRRRAQRRRRQPDVPGRAEPARPRDPRRDRRPGRGPAGGRAGRGGSRRSSLATSMGLVGTLTVELFLMPDGSLVVNELAPRVHNSGHWSIEGAVTSQFEQHLRAICGLPLGSVGDARARRRRWSTCSARARRGPPTRPASTRRSRSRTRTSTCTTRRRCSSAGRWAT